MKYLLILFTLPMFCQAQESYCMLLGTKKFMSNNVTVQVDFGQGLKTWKPNESFLKNDDGSKMVFNSMIDALNYMASQGWEFVDAYITSTNNQLVYNWILKTTVSLKAAEE